MLSLSFEEPVPGADDFARIRARGAQKLYGNGETRHSLKSLIADVPLEETADGRVCLRMGDALAVGLPMATFATTRGHSALTEMIGAEAISRVLNTSRKLVASRLLGRGLTPRGVVHFCGVSQDKPSPLFTDNDGTWYVSRDAASTVNMTYIIRHVRTLQQAEYDGLMNARQLDGELNPTDVLTKHKPKQTGKARLVQETRAAAKLVSHLLARGIQPCNLLSDMGSARRVVRATPRVQTRVLLNAEIAAGVVCDGRRRWAVDCILAWRGGTEKRNHTEALVRWLGFDRLSGVPHADTWELRSRLTADLRDGGRQRGVVETAFCLKP